MRHVSVRHLGYLLILTLLLILFVLASLAVSPQHDDGIVGTTRKNGEGCVCHDLSPSGGVSTWVTGPAVVAPGSEHVFSVHITGGPAQTGGFNVATFRGSLAAADGETRLIGDELTQTHPKVFAAGEVQWSFTYHAPATLGPDTLYSVGNSTNNNLIPDDADQWNLGENFIISVAAAPPQPAPVLNGWGIGLLALLLGAISVVALRRGHTT